jgi:hypothetical protein
MSDQAERRPLGVGDTVKVLRAARLPIEEAIGIGPIERITRDISGQRLYWVRGFACARMERVLRRCKLMADVWAEQEEGQ